MVLHGGDRRFCPICDSPVSRFLSFGDRSGECCPVCTSMRRHRALWLFLTRYTDLFSGTPRRLLHFAPEPALEAKLSKTASIDYVTADLYAPRVMDREDITGLTYPDQSFDVVICSHVLEHVPRDREAMRELARVVRPGGWVVIMVPLHGSAVTDEDLNVTDPVERERRFGQFEHVRSYGLDLIDRLLAAGFHVRRFTPAAFASAQDLERFHIDADEPIFLCTLSTT